MLTAEERKCVNDHCHICELPFEPECLVELIEIRVSKNPIKQSGHPYGAMVVQVHINCASELKF